MSYVCVTCDQQFPNIPDDAAQLTERRRITVYRFADGTVHSIRHDWTGGNIAKSLHTRWHKNKPSKDCLLCFPPPVEQVESVQEAQATLPEPEQIVTPPDPVQPEKPTTAMAAAFARIFKS